MDEQVIQDLYQRAVSKGYKKDKSEFIKLLHSDDEVLNDNFSYVKTKIRGAGPAGNHWGSSKW